MSDTWTNERPRDWPRQWHRLFGIVVTDVFTGSGWRVELEKELALQSQLLDVVIIEQIPGRGETPPLLPDGLEGLRAHNLLTYKSVHEPLDGWALEELVGHYVNYRKLTSLARQRANSGEVVPEWLPERDFQLYAVATRYPDKLAREVALAPTAWEGGYDVRWGTRTLRLIVLNHVAQAPHNAPWELFSAQMERVRHGVEHFRARSRGAEALLHELYLRFKLELPNMAYTMDDFIRESNQHVLSQLSVEERAAFLQQLPADERLRGLPADEVLKRFSPDEVLKRFSPEERLSGLGAEDLQRLKDALNKKLN